MAGPSEPVARKERLDKFLFFARALKSRTLAQKTIEAGAIRVNSERTLNTDHRVGAGDILTMTLHGRIVIWKILDVGERRGPASEAAGLYEVLSPPSLPREQLSAFERAVGERVPGSGRPTKKERRDTDRLVEDPED